MAVPVYEKPGTVRSFVRYRGLREWGEDVERATEAWRTGGDASEKDKCGRLCARRSEEKGRRGRKSLLGTGGQEGLRPWKEARIGHWALGGINASASKSIMARRKVVIRDE